MLSIGAMGGGQGAYYTGLAREDYYLGGGEPPGIWWGQGSKDLGLSGHVDAESLDRLFEGFHPLEDRALIQNAGSPDHQPGWDLTFSAPKSVSVLWSQADPATRKIIQDAHLAAVKAGLSYIEDTAAVTRRGKGGVGKEEAQLIIATFEHGTSRAQDPQLHTHCLVMNVCTRADGTSGTIESKPLYQSKMTAGALYRAEFALQLENRLHLSIERKGSCFEVGGVPERSILEFSKRRAEIEKKLEEKGYHSAEAAAAATLSTRQVKGHVAREELFQEWQSVGDGIGWGPKEAATFLKKARTTERKIDEEKKRALFQASDRATEQQSFFTEREFIRYVAEEAQGRGFGAATVREIGATQLPWSLDTVSLGRHKKTGEAVYTTREMMDLERKLLDEVEHSKTHHSAGLSETVLTGVIASRHKLNDEQKVALRHLCEEGDGTIRVVSGMAGTGKTSLLAAARFGWELEGFKIYGAALAGKAAEGLSDGARIKSETLHRTLWDLETGKLRLDKKSVLVIDEAGMIGTRQMQRLVNATEKVGARLVLVGDAKQLQSVEAGGPFAEIEHRLPSVSLINIQRQKEAWAKEAVHDFAAGRAEEGLAAYAERGLLSISPDRKKAYGALISAWKEEGIHAPDEQLIFTGTRLEAAILNRMAQDERLKAGVLGKEGVTTPEGSGNFHVKDRVIFTKKSKLYGVENGTAGSIVAVDEDASVLYVRVNKGDRVTIPLEEFPHVKLGYAATTHKAQGVTVKRGLVLAGGSMQDREITYVQVSRACDKTQIFTDEETAGDGITRLVRQMSESRQKEMAHTVQRHAAPEQQPIQAAPEQPIQAAAEQKQSHAAAEQKQNQDRTSQSQSQRY